MRLFRPGREQPSFFFVIAFVVLGVGFEIGCSFSSASGQIWFGVSLKDASVVANGLVAALSQTRVWGKGSGVTVGSEMATVS
uniref:Uncharacterized protein n=1 Tax=Cannabis sativa TaxID=3483 RepID=A0A803PTC8_CANSA